MPLRHPSEDIANRLPVWQAMTEFYLDTELTEITVSYIARTCSDSPYSIRELDQIMFAEVWPAFLPNLLSMAGEWAGWSNEFVKERVLKCYKPRFYLSWKLNPMKRFYCSEWDTVVRQIKAARGGGGAGPQ